MTVEDQFDILKAFNEGTPVYYRSKYSSDAFNWKPVEAEHQFDFNGNVYYKNTPLSFEEALAENEANAAFHMAIDRLSKTELGFCFHVTDRDERDRVVREYKACNFDCLYRLWNVAAKYGNLRKEALTDVTEKEGKFND